MSTKKHTIKECKTLLRSCASMLDSMYPNIPLSSLDKFFYFEHRLSRLSLSFICKANVDTYFERIVSLYNKINSEFIDF